MQLLHAYLSVLLVYVRLCKYVVVVHVSEDVQINAHAA